MKKFLQVIAIVVIFTIIYILNFHMIWRSVIPIFTYYGYISLVILTVLLSIIMFFVCKKGYFNFDIKDGIIVVILCFFSNALFFGMVPVTMERSVSVYMLNEMSKNGAKTEKEIEKDFIDNYVIKYGAFDKRIKEQTAINTIEKDDKGKYGLSDKGKLMISIFKFIDKVFNIKSNLLN